MALINCPECNNQISDKAEACPYCGLPGSYFCAGGDSAKEACVAECGNPAYIGTDTIGPVSTDIPAQTGHHGSEPTPGYGTMPGPIIDHDAAPDPEPDYSIIRNVLISFEKDYAELFANDRYIPSSEQVQLYEQYHKYLELLKDSQAADYIESNHARLGFDLPQVARFKHCMRQLHTEVDRHNENFISEKLIKYKAYFDNMLKAVDPDVLLDEEQRRAVLTDDDYCLLIAGAGAGKTTTMAAKVKYLVDKCSIDPRDIIVISYTNKAVEELKERICDKLRIPAKVTTFHAFGYELLKKASPEPPQVNPYAYNIVFEMLEKSIYGNKSLLKKLILFFGYYFDVPETVMQFKSLNEYHQYKAALDFETIKSGLGQYIKTVADKRKKKSYTIRGEYLRSVQEVQIANFLYMNSIDYEYEKPYPFATGVGRKKYTPDFYIQQGENDCYIEHFGITESYRSFIYSPKDLARYIKGINYKRDLHRKHGTGLITTWAAYNDKRQFIEHLAEELTKKGFVLKPRSDEEVYRQLAATSKDKYIVKLILFMLEFIEKFKSNGYNASGFEVLENKTDNVRTRLFLSIARAVYDYYQDRLKQNNQIDFADMINDAEILLREMEDAHITLTYKYIIIDEFQDIARQRFNLTKRLADITGAKVVAVGDDWQSIYAFAGADISLFTRFLELMGAGRELQITHTYRNSQELIDIAGNFIQKNPLQIKKRLISPKSIKNPIVIQTYDDSFKPNKFRNLALIEVIGKIVEEHGPKSSILLIGRYGFDRHAILNSGGFSEQVKNKFICEQYPEEDITFMTAHSSKGLGYDNVIIVNMLESKYGFPAQIENDPIINMVTFEDKTVPFAEERRLFYVALTRTKNRVYILAPLSKPSRFLVELTKEHDLSCAENLNKNIVDHFNLRCPECGFPLQYEFNKNYGLRLFMCTNDPEVCDFMTNDRVACGDIFKCPRCDDGYMIVRKSKTSEERFFGCTNYSPDGKGCNFMMKLK